MAISRIKKAPIRRSQSERRGRRNEGENRNPSMFIQETLSHNHQKEDKFQSLISCTKWMTPPRIFTMKQQFHDCFSFFFLISKLLPQIIKCKIAITQFVYRTKNCRNSNFTSIYDIPLDMNTMAN